MTTRRKIAVVVSTYPPYRGGMGNVAVAHVEAFRRDGHDVTVFAPGAGLTPVFRYGNAGWVPQLLWKLRDFDLVELHYPFFGGAEFVWLWKLLFGREKKLVVLYHMDVVGRGALGLVFRAYRALLLKPILRLADRIVVASLDYLASSDAAFMKGDVRVREVPLSVDTARLHPDADVAKERAVMFVGGLDQAHYFKGLERLIDAFALLKRDVPEAKLWIVGDGDLRSVYERRADACGLSGRVVFWGKLDDASLAERFRAAAVHVLPSVDRSEAFGLVTLEAAASGLPSVVSDLPGVRSTVVSDETGFLVPPAGSDALADRLTQLLRDPDLCARMGRAARSRAEREYANDAVASRLRRAVFE